MTKTPTLTASMVTRGVRKRMDQALNPSEGIVRSARQRQIDEMVAEARDEIGYDRPNAIIVKDPETVLEPWERTRRFGN